MRPNVPDYIRAPFESPTQRGDINGVALARVVPIFLPEDHPIPDAQEFNPSGTTSTVGVETGTAIVLAPQVGSIAGFIMLPAGNIGVIRSLTISITNMLTTTNVTFTLTINGGPVPGYAALRMTPRVAPYVSNEFGEPGMRVRVPVSSKIGVVFSNIDGGTYVVGASVGGWYWPEASGTRWLRIGS